LRKAVQSFQKNYFWIYNNYFDTRVLEEEEIILEVKKRLKSKRKFTSSLVTNKQKVTLIKQLKIDQETQNLLNISDQFTYFQDLRKKWIMIYAHYLEVLLAEVGRRAKMTIHEMRYTFPHEIQFLLQGKKIDVAPRQKNCLVVFKEGAKRGDFYLGQKAKVAERKYISQADTQGDQQILKGKVACSGKAIGPVKVLMNPSESYKVNHGDILVTSMTSPDFMAAMRKCVGIITNEGGLTCHAAVVSRELNIPCVIATKNATKVLKDCDRVEIDADTGTIYLVS
jgi:phosphoenolpyruvate synthase/pyruvate phosphate dikinase